MAIPTKDEVLDHLTRFDPEELERMDAYIKSRLYAEVMGEVCEVPILLTDLMKAVGDKDLVRAVLYVRSLLDTCFDKRWRITVLNGPLENPNRLTKIVFT